MKIKISSPITLWFCLLSFIGFLLCHNDNLVNFFVLKGDFIKNQETWFISCLAYIFGHADFSHFFGNISILLLIGPIVETRYGSKNLLIFSIIASIITMMLHCTTSNGNLLGISGIVFMMIILSASINLTKEGIPLTFILVILIYIGKELLSISTNDNVSHLAHLTGGFTGLIIALKNKTPRNHAQSSV